MSLDRRRANLEARELAITDELAGMGPDKAGGLPNYRGSGGVDHVGYIESLQAQLKFIREELAIIGRTEDASGGGATVSRFVDI